jgi:dTDP-4-dehydrorhamnose 3,5-epimerase
VVRADAIAGVWVVQPDVHRDDRGRFVETYRRAWFPGARAMVQGNRADRQAGTLVGLHFHRRQADYWYVQAGQARIVLHDLRVGAPTEGATMHFDLSGDADRGLYIPPGVAHGFAAHTDVTISYLVDGYYDPDDELGVAWDDPGIAAEWGITQPVLSDRDRANPRRAELSSAELPPWDDRSRV